MKKNHYFDYLIGRSLQAARIDAKKTKKSIYTHFGISRQTYERYENGESSAPIPLVLDILTYCGVSSLKDLGDDFIKDFSNSAYGRTLLKWFNNKNG
jgi:DNA-binding XRE family transcriptional regulator